MSSSSQEKAKREINTTNHENERVEARIHKRNKMKTCN